MWQISKMLHNFTFYSLTNIWKRWVPVLSFRCASCKYEVKELADAPAGISVEDISEDVLMAVFKTKHFVN